MARKQYEISNETHETCGKQCFNETWELLENPDRSDSENDLMLHRAHCSKYHWLHVGQPKHFARGDWLLSRVYAVLGHSELAIHFANQCAATCDANNLSAFDKAYAHEALARGLAVAGDAAKSRTHTKQAESLAPSIDNEQERQWLLDDLNTINV